MSEDVRAIWRNFYDSPDGHKAIAWLMQEAGIYSENIPQDPMAAGIMIGERNLAVKIAAMCGRKEEKFVDDVRDDSDVLERILKMQPGD